MRQHEPDPAVEAALDAALRGDAVEPDHADLAALVAHVRAQRPAMDPAFAAALEERVASGFAADEPAPQLPARRWRAWRPAVAVAVAASLAAVVVLPTVLGEDDELTVSEAPSAMEEGGGQAGGGGEEPSRAENQADVQSSSDDALPAPDAPGRAVERITGLTLTGPDATVQSIANEAIAVADRVEGFVETSTVDVGEGRATADLTLRVPTDRADDALAALSRLADVRERTQQTTDLTESLDSTQERLEDARATRDGLRNALEEASSAEEVTDLRERLEEARARVRTLGGERAGLRERTSLATIDVEVRGTGGPPATQDDEGGAWTPGDALDDALDVLRVAAGVAIVALAAAVPLAVVLGLAVLTVGLFRRRVRERALDAAA
ncbi:MAG: DUF4349 domain-containing protein [Solirubrobacteraceae bacterium MAG38_C4-C5]|nr:DUF4349 domain-containing protein [Candidatus Siliceabacter maunaloa]